MRLLATNPSNYGFLSLHPRFSEIITVCWHRRYCDVEDTYHGYLVVMLAESQPDKQHLEEVETAQLSSSVSLNQRE